MLIPYDCCNLLCMDACCSKFVLSVLVDMGKHFILLTDCQTKQLDTCEHLQHFNHFIISREPSSLQSPLRRDLSRKNLRRHEFLRITISTLEWHPLYHDLPRENLLHCDLYTGTTFSPLRSCRISFSILRAPSTLWSQSCRCYLLLPLHWLVCTKP